MKLVSTRSEVVGAFTTMMSGSGRLRIASVICAILMVWGLQALGATAASAETRHIFDPTLSLTGGTATDSLDPVADPGPVHPPKPFAEPCGVATDPVGDVYVASLGEPESGGLGIPGGRIDVFNPAGEFLVEIQNEFQPCDVAVDAAGNVYFVQKAPGSQGIFRYTPDTYPPTAATDYGSPTLVSAGSGTTGLAVNQQNGHLFANRAFSVAEYSSAAEGNNLLRSDIGEGVISFGNGIAVDATTGDIFVGSLCEGCPNVPDSLHPHVSVVYVFDSSGALKTTVTGSDLPSGGFSSSNGQLYPGVDEATGELFIADFFVSSAKEPRRVYRFVPSASSYAYQPDPELEEHGFRAFGRLAVSNGSSSPTRGNVYVTAPSGTNSHVFAFIPGEIGPPAISNLIVREVTTDEAEFRADVNPGGAGTTYRFEYVDARTFDEDEATFGAGHGFDHAASTEARTLPGGSQYVTVSSTALNLMPDTSYRVRLVASNRCVPFEKEHLCTAESEVITFATYPRSPQLSCPNEALRAGLDALLPDCRAYELVTPADTNGREPTAVPIGFGFDSFQTELATADGKDVLFMTDGGALPGFDGNGIADGYEAVRSDGGWTTRAAGPDGGQTQAPGAGGASADHGYWFWETGNASDHGSLVIGEETSHYVRLPDGTFRLIGIGPVGTDPRAVGRWISPGGTHLIFTSTQPLTSDASPPGTLGIYDTWADGTTHLVSTTPSGEAPPAGADVEYLGTSADGEVVAFSVKQSGVTTLYEHRSGSSPVAVATGTASFAGLSHDGRFLTYLLGGNIFSFDRNAGVSSPVGTGGESTVVNVSADGSHVYFVSPKVLGSDDGPVGGKQNFYMWQASSGEISYIARLTNQDLKGTETGEGPIFGLGQWVPRMISQKLAYDPSRSTPNGGAIVFESHGNLAGYNSQGHSGVYRYARGEQPELLCLSCDPTLAAPTADSHLQIPSLSDLSAVTAGRTPVRNVSDDGRTVFFQSEEALVPTDLDGKLDVYEWEVDGAGGCERPAGCVSLISSGHSIGSDYLYAATPSGSDVFFSSSDVLANPDQDTTSSLYDARVNGGFPVSVPVPCTGEPCRGQATPAPSQVSPATQGQARGNARPARHCRKGFKRVKRGGKSRCVRKHHDKRRRGKAGHRRGGGHR